MIRALAYLIATVLVIGVVRSIIGIVLKGFADLFHPPGPSQNAPSQKVPRTPAVPAGGELKKDPVCGTFISTATAIQKKAGGETYYFCSAECRDKFKG
jgi:YHS domain-containing protein